jgi:hypothetical protein
MKESLCEKCQNLKPIIDDILDWYNAPEMRNWDVPEIVSTLLDDLRADRAELFCLLEDFKKKEEKES